MDYEMVKVNKMMKLSDVASKMEVSEDVINILNAELRYKVTPNYEYTIKIPKIPPRSLTWFTVKFRKRKDLHMPQAIEATAVVPLISNIAFVPVKTWPR